MCFEAGIQFTVTMCTLLMILGQGKKSEIMTDRNS